MGAERTGNDVLGNEAGDFLLRDTAGRHHFPHQAMVEGKLLENTGSQAVDPAVPHVGHDCPLRQNGKHAARGAHAVKFGIGFPTLVDVHIRLHNGLSQGFWGRTIAQLLVDVGEPPQANLLASSPAA